MLKLIYHKLDHKRFYFILALLICIVGTEIALTCYIPEWRNGFYTVMKDKVESEFSYQILLLIGLYTGLGFAQGLKTWIGQKTSFLIRIALSKITLKSFVKSGAQKKEAYSQAMTGAIQNSTELFLRVLVEIIISASIVFVLIFSNLDKPLILIAATAYTAGVSLVAYLFQRPLMVTDKTWQEAESTYRESIVTIANGKGDFTSKEKFLKLIEAYYNYIKTQMYFQLMSRLKGVFGSVIPYFLLGTAYFQGDIDFGQFMAGVVTFELLVVNMTIFIIMYPDYIKAKASQEIIRGFMK